MSHAECIDTITEMLRSSSQEAKDFFKNTLVNFYDKADLLCNEAYDNEMDEFFDSGYDDFNEFKKNKEDEDETTFSEVDNVPRFLQCHLVDSNAARDCFQEQMNNHIRRNFRYPLAAQEQGIQGKVYINFIINKCGFIEDIKTRAPDKTLDDEAIRIISLLPRMLPGTLENGTPINVPFSLPITFRLE